MPFSISCRARSSGVGCAVVSSDVLSVVVFLREGLEGGVGLKPRLAGGRVWRPFSTEPTARSARKLTLFIISSMRDYQGGCFVSWEVVMGLRGGGRRTYHWWVAEVLCQEGYV